VSGDGHAHFNRLSDRTVRTVGVGMYCDGGGLSAAAGKDGQLSRSRGFCDATGEITTSKTGKIRKVERAMGLGSFPDLSLADARAKAADARRHGEQEGVAARALEFVSAWYEAREMPTWRAKASHLGGGMGYTTLPGLRMSLGSRARLSVPISSRATGSLNCASALRFITPMPCSAEMEPANFATS
jgi:hypothetical protein